jgi:hypothetical protein
MGDGAGADAPCESVTCGARRAGAAEAGAECLAKGFNKRHPCIDGMENAAPVPITRTTAISAGMYHRRVDIVAITRSS